jgi:hypothetical protein
LRPPQFHPIDRSAHNFRDKTDCRRHVEARHLALAFRCRRCNYVAKTSHSLRKHEMTQHVSTSLLQ